MWRYFRIEYLCTFENNNQRFAFVTRDEEREALSTSAGGGCVRDRVLSVPVGGRLRTRHHQTHWSRALRASRPGLLSAPVASASTIDRCSFKLSVFRHARFARASSWC